MQGISSSEVERAKHSDIEAVIDITTVGSAAPFGHHVLITQPAEMIRHKILWLFKQPDDFLDTIVGTAEQHENFPAHVVSQQLEEARRLGR